MSTDKYATLFFVFTVLMSVALSSTISSFMIAGAKNDIVAEVSRKQSVNLEDGETLTNTISKQLANPESLSSISEIHKNNPEFFNMLINLLAVMSSETKIVNTGNITGESITNNNPKATSVINRR